MLFESCLFYREQGARRSLNVFFAHHFERTNSRRTVNERLSTNDKQLTKGVGRFRSCLYEWGMASSAACECGIEKQTVGHVVLQCPIHRPPHGLYGLTVLDDEIMEWLLNICREISCGQAVVRRTGSEDVEYAHCDYFCCSYLWSVRT